MEQSIIGIVLAGGMGERLRPLTDARAKPAVPFGGIYRIIDFCLSNCLNSDIRRVLVLTQYKSRSLSRHLKTGYNFLSRRLDEFLDEIPAQMQIGDQWYKGTADAIRQNFQYIDDEKPSQVLVAPGDHIYKMDYRIMTEFHRAHGACMTIATSRVDATRASGEYGVLQTDETGRVLAFAEKPAEPAKLPGTDQCLASMGIYLFETEALRTYLREEYADFGRDVLPAMLAAGAPVYAFDFTDRNVIQEYEFVSHEGQRQKRLVNRGSDSDYWRDVGTIESFWLANLDLVAPSPRFNLYGENWPIFSYPEHFPPAKFVHETTNRVGMAVNSIVCDGVIISGAKVRNSVLSPGVYVHSYSLVENSVLFGGSIEAGIIDETSIGRNSRVRNAIIDKNVKMSEGTVLGYDRAADEARGLRTVPITGSTEHIVVVPKGKTL